MSSATIVGDYVLGPVLGQGKFGTVHEATHRTTGARVAIKIMSRKAVTATWSSAVRFRREASIVSRLDHPAVVKMHEVIETEAAFYMVMELMPGGTLMDAIEAATPGEGLPVATCRYIFSQLMGGVYYCHSEHVAHRDLKPANILLDEHGRVKIADFGLASKQGDSGMANACGTPYYIAPELLRDQPYDPFQADVWSCGVVLYVLLTGRRPFESTNAIALFGLIERAEFTLPTGLPPAAADLLPQMLCASPEARITVEEVLAHEWVQSVLNPSTIPTCTVVGLRRTTHRTSEAESNSFSCEASTCERSARSVDN